MGLFFNYDKPGKGIDKDAPKKKGVFLYFELFFRKFWLLMKANMLYCAVSLPVMAIYNFLIINAISVYLPNDTQGVSWHLSLIFTVLITILWGTGPATGGFTYLLRNFAREEHVWVVSDFFEKTKESFKLGMVVLIMDIVLLFLGINAASVYMAFIKQGIGFARYALALLGVLFLFYTFMHFYVYEFCVTFENKTVKTIKNAFITGMATLPVNFLISAPVTVLTVLLFGHLTPFALILVAFLMWISFMKFPVDFYAARMLKRRFIDSKNGESGE